MKIIEANDCQWIFNENSKLLAWKELITELISLESTKVIVLDSAEIMKHNFKSVSSFREQLRVKARTALSMRLVIREVGDKLYIAKGWGNNPLSVRKGEESV